MNSFSSESFFIARLRKHDEKAISYLYEHYTKLFSGIISKVLESYRFCSWSCNDKEITKDITQEIIIRVCYSIQKYDETKGSLSAWLCIVTRNAALDFCQNRRNHFNYRKVTRSHLIDCKEGNGSLKDPLEIDNKLDINVAVQQIKPGLFKIFHLVYIQGYTASETANILQIPVGTVKTRMRAGLAIVRNYLRKDQNAVTYLLKSAYGNGT